MDLLTTAKEIADRVEAESVKQNVPVAVTVIDIHGNVVLTHRMTGAPAFSLELSERKAYTSALVRMRTADLVPLVQPGAPLYPLLAVSGGRYSAMGGGVPLTSEDRVIAGRRSQRWLDGAGHRHRRSRDGIDRSYLIVRDRVRVLNDGGHEIAGAIRQRQEGRGYRDEQVDRRRVAQPSFPARAGILQTSYRGRIERRAAAPRKCRLGDEPAACPKSGLHDLGETGVAM
jgi:uncharacterized protein GlcG (DUF336 family)